MATKDEQISALIDPAEVSGRIKKASHILGLMPEDYEEKVHAELRSSISNRESLERLVPLELYIAIAKTLGVSVHWLLFGRIVSDIDSQAEHSDARDPRD